MLIPITFRKTALYVTLKKDNLGLVISEKIYLDSSEQCEITDLLVNLYYQEPITGRYLSLYEHLIDTAYDEEES